MTRLSGWPVPVALWVGLMICTAPAFAERGDDDTMIVVEEGATPDDIVNVIELPRRPGGTGHGTESGADAGPESQAKSMGQQIAEEAKAKSLGQQVREDVRQDHKRDASEYGQSHRPDRQ